MMVNNVLIRYQIICIYTDTCVTFVQIGARYNGNIINTRACDDYSYTFNGGCSYDGK